MKAGDRFIRYSKNQSPILGIVDRVWSAYVVDTTNKVIIKKEMIASIDGKVYEMRQCYEIDRDISVPFLRKIQEILTRKFK
jgi:hypothetical protein